MDLSDAFAYAEHLVELHGLTEWSVAFDGAKRRAGQCRFADQVISLSAPITALHSEAEVRDTVLHEIAHAIVGARHGHDDVWRATAVRIGCSGERCVSAESAQVETPWLGVCSAGHTIGRHRRPERVLACGQCSRTFDVNHLIVWTHHGLPAQHHPNYVAELERLKRGEVMRLLRVGTTVRINADGEYWGRTGTIAKRGRTSYHVRLPGSRSRSTVVRVPFSLVEAVRKRSAQGARR